MARRRKRQAGVFAIVCRSRSLRKSGCRVQIDRPIAARALQQFGNFGCLRRRREEGASAARYVHFVGGDFLYRMTQYANVI